MSDTSACTHAGVYLCVRARSSGGCVCVYTWNNLIYLNVVRDRVRPFASRHLFDIWIYWIFKLVASAKCVHVCECVYATVVFIFGAGALWKLLMYPLVVLCLFFFFYSFSLCFCSVAEFRRKISLITGMRSKQIYAYTHTHTHTCVHSVRWTLCCGQFG